MIAPGRFFRKVFVPCSSSYWAFGSCASCTSGQPARVPRLLFKKPLNWERVLRIYVYIFVTPSPQFAGAFGLLVRLRVEIIDERATALEKIRPARSIGL